MFFVTGAVVTPPVYEWATSVLPPTTHVMSATGGTDICSTCMLSPLGIARLYTTDSYGKQLLVPVLACLRMLEVSILMVNTSRC